MLSKPSSKQDENSLDFFPFKSLYQVLDSMQGLRQVIQGVSLDEIVEADEKAKRLIQRLSSLQAGLAGLDATKKFLAKVKATVSSQPSSYQLPQTTVPNLDAIKKLLAKIKEPSAIEKKISLPHELATLEATKQFLAKVKETIARARLEDRTESKKDIPKKALNNLIPFPGPSKVAKEESKSSSSETPLEEALSLAENHLAVETRIPKTSPNQPTEDRERTARQPHDFTLGEEPLREEKFELGFSLTESREQKATLPKAIDAGNPSAKMESTPTKRDEESTKLEVSFDQDLLTKLIKDYGEFTIYTKLSAEPKASVSPANPIDTTPLPSQQGAPKTNLLRERSHSWQHKEGDLDKKLKKLMNDYGNVDKYSTNRNDKIKKAALAIGALVLISAISAFFFISRPTTQPPVQRSSAETSPAVPTESLNSPLSQTPATNIQPAKKNSKSSKPAGEKESPAAKEE
jgi:hypothetical protein